MWYWNDKNFEGLLMIADCLDEDKRLKELAEYCRLREQGLRQLAFGALNKFLIDSANWNIEETREIIDIVYQIQFSAPDVHQFITTPLNKQFLQPGLKAWLADEPTSRQALRWDGLFNDNLEALKKLLALYPDETKARRVLIKRNCIDIIYYATHLCQVNQLLLPLPKIADSIATAEDYLRSAPDRSALKDLEAALNEQKRMLDDWKAFCEAEASDFTDWCKNNGKTHKWGALYFYE